MARTYGGSFIEVRKATLASILRKSRHGLRLNEHMEHPEGDVVFCGLARELVHKLPLKNLHG